MANVLDILPELHGDELSYIQHIISDMDDTTAKRFANVYRARRKNPQEILIFTIIGFLGIAGIQRIVLNQVGMGVLFFFTVGLCYIGTIIDLINYQKLTYEYNQKVANEVRVAAIS
ncbi:TM2 domain-containing protein [Fulvivirga sp. RKSG066]|uniref:TM2 domain-containing protein n=1 Tax=Fulvivirga aurantia TaxID=2529383 RepID=UPI0012BC8D8F|nr:TM2 domain-containing protein [Fulvivirga aurantia]MTI21468.1 TM2 domain-containing protein [Fulvivirga aurantia]